MVNPFKEKSSAAGGGGTREPTRRAEISFPN